MIVKNINDFTDKVTDFSNRPKDEEFWVQTGVNTRVELRQVIENSKPEPTPSSGITEQRVKELISQLAVPNPGEFYLIDLDNHSFGYGDIGVEVSNVIPGLLRIADPRPSYESYIYLIIPKPGAYYAFYSISGGSSYERHIAIALPPGNTETTNVTIWPLYAKDNVGYNYYLDLVNKLYSDFDPELTTNCLPSIVEFGVGTVAQLALFGVEGYESQYPQALVEKSSKELFGNDSGSASYTMSTCCTIQPRYRTKGPLGKDTNFYYLNMGSYVDITF